MTAKTCNGKSNNNGRMTSYFHDEPDVALKMTGYFHDKPGVALKMTSQVRL